MAEQELITLAAVVGESVLQEEAVDRATRLEERVDTSGDLNALPRPRSATNYGGVTR
jgi:hypothetical protein